MTRTHTESEALSDGELLIVKMNAIRDLSERHVDCMHAEAERLVD